MYWNHRIIKRVEDGFESYCIVEVHYDEDDHRILGWTQDCVDPYSESIEGLHQTLHWMLDAFDKPVLDESQLEIELEARPEPEEPYERLTVQELLDSLGLERDDVEGWENEGGHT